VAVRVMLSPRGFSSSQLLYIGEALSDKQGI
jgi:hypothetical protein